MKSVTVKMSLRITPIGTPPEPDDEYHLQRYVRVRDLYLQGIEEGSISDINGIRKSFRRELAQAVLFGWFSRDTARALLRSLPKNGETY